MFGKGARWPHSPDASVSPDNNDPAEVRENCFLSKEWFPKGRQTAEMVQLCGVTKYPTTRSKTSMRLMEMMGSWLLLMLAVRPRTNRGNQNGYLALSQLVSKVPVAVGADCSPWRCPVRRWSRIKDVYVVLIRFPPSESYRHQPGRHSS